MKRPHEIMSNDSFALWLASRFPREPVGWVDVPQQNEPPDWYINIGSKTFAGEATSMVESLEI